MSLESVGKLVAAHSSETSPVSDLKLEKAEAEQAIVRRMFTWMTYAVFKGILDGVSISGKTTPKSVSSATPIKSFPTERTPVPLPSVTERTTQLISPQDVSKSSK